MIKWIKKFFGGWFENRDARKIINSDESLFKPAREYLAERKRDE